MSNSSLCLQQLGIIQIQVNIPHAMTIFDEMTVRQMVSSIKVLDKERLLVCFRDGEQIVVEKMI